MVNEVQEGALYMQHKTFEEIFSSLLFDLGIWVIYIGIDHCRLIVPREIEILAKCLAHPPQNDSFMICNPGVECHNTKCRGIEWNARRGDHPFFHGWIETYLR